MSLIFLLSFFVVEISAAECQAPEICRQLERRYEASSLNPDSQAAFLALIDVARRSLYRDCPVEGMGGEIPNFKACYYQGFVEENGKFMRPARAPFTEEEVKRWFLYIQNAPFPEGRQFTSSNEFAAALDPSWRLEILPEGAWSVSE